MGTRRGGNGESLSSDWPRAQERGSVKSRADQVWAFFFFQAEDGIRDLTVTGVQTCALPISGQDLRTVQCQAPGRFREGLVVVDEQAQPADRGVERGEHVARPVRRGLAGRQEIGRASVGKECRSRWSPYH